MKWPMRYLHCIFQGRGYYCEISIMQNALYEDFNLHDIINSYGCSLYMQTPNDNTENLCTEGYVLL